MSLVRGFDVSSYQAVTSWAKAAASAEFALVKATEGTSFISPTWGSYFAAARKTGLLVGSYHFARPESSARDQARHYVKALRSASWRTGRDLPPVLDIETTGGRNQAALTDWCLDFLHEVDDRLELGGPWLRCGVYCNNQFRREKFDGARVLDGRWLMLASWPTAYRRSWPPESARPVGAAIWQFTDSGVGLVAGIKGAGLDLDVARHEDLVRLAPLHYGRPLEDDMPLTDDDVRRLAKAAAEAVHNLDTVPNRSAERAGKKGKDATRNIDNTLADIEDTQEGHGRQLAAVSKALEALARGLGPTVEQAVTEALAEGAVSVDVNVHVPASQEAK